ncbi:MAG: AEC family transporter, partial [Rhizobiaceae bacterium]
MLEVIGLVAPFFGLILIGYGLGRRSKLSQDQMGWMNFFIIYVALPALFFKLMAKTPVEQLANWRFVLSTTGVTFLLFVTVLLGARFLRREALPVAMIQGFAAAYGNIGYMAPGLALMAFGPEAALPVALIFCFDNALHFTMAPLIMARARHEGGGWVGLVWGALRSIFSHPFILATIVGVGAAGFGVVLPEPADRLVDLLANAAAPCALFAMGVTLAQRPLQSVPVELSYIIPVKLIVHPLMAWAALGLLGPFPDVWVYTAMLICALPTAANVFVLAQQYETWGTKASAAILTTTFLSIVTVSTLLYLIKQGFVP